MKILKLWIETGYCGANYEEEYEVPDDITEEICEEAAKNYLSNNIDFGWVLEEK